jgi:hypothetical protein
MVLTSVEKGWLILPTSYLRLPTRQRTSLSLGLFRPKTTSASSKRLARSTYRMHINILNDQLTTCVTQTTSNISILTLDSTILIFSTEYEKVGTSIVRISIGQTKLINHVIYIHVNLHVRMSSPEYTISSTSLRDDD